jgi:hypothetical protein
VALFAGQSLTRELQQHSFIGGFGWLRGCH